MAHVQESDNKTVYKSGPLTCRLPEPILRRVYLLRGERIPLKSKKCMSSRIEQISRLDSAINRLEQIGL